MTSYQFGLGCPGLFSMQVARDYIMKDSYQPPRVSRGLTDRFTNAGVVSMFQGVNAPAVMLREYCFTLIWQHRAW